MAVPVKYDVLAVKKLCVEIHAGIDEKFIWLPLFTAAEFVSSLELGGGCGSHGLLPWVFWGRAQGSLQHHSETVSVGSGGSYSK